MKLIHAQKNINKFLNVGIASGDISPNFPVRLGGFGIRVKSESASLLHKLETKVLVIGGEEKDFVVFVTLDLVGLSDYITTGIKNGVIKKYGMREDQIAISVSHTHGAPEVGNILNILQYRENRFSDSLLTKRELNHIALYNEQVVNVVLKTVDAAFENCYPSVVAWGQGQAFFSENRRINDGPVDPALPFIRVTSPKGDLRGVLLSYACHGTTLPGSFNEIHGDWISEAKMTIEKRHPETKAMIALGCAGDISPSPRGEIRHMEAHGIEIANSVDRLLEVQLDTLTSVPASKMIYVDLPFENVPTIKELVKTVKEDTTIKGFYSRLVLERILRGDQISHGISYPIQVWTFGNQLCMVNLAGEVVVDYSRRIKELFGADKIWVNAYMNEIPSYIASKRVIQMGGYEAETSMYYYDKPSPFSLEIEDIIIDGVSQLILDEFKQDNPRTNKLKKIKADLHGIYYLLAADAESSGPNIKYMPEWKAFGWFNTEDKVKWQLKVETPGYYDVILEWSVADEQSGKTYLIESGRALLEGKIKKTGSWFTFQKRKIGEIFLEKGKNTLIFRSGDKTEDGAMLDLRQLILIPK